MKDVKGALLVSLFAAAVLTACDTAATPTPVPAEPTPAPATVTTIASPAPTTLTETASLPSTNTPEPPTATPAIVPNTATATPESTSTLVPTREVPTATTAELPLPSATRTRVLPTPTRVAPTRTPAVRPTLTQGAALPSPTGTPHRIAATATQAASGAPKLEVIASGFGSPDDLLVLPAGDIVFGDFGNNALNIVRVGSDRAVLLAGGLNEPEGIVQTRDGALVVVEQKTNRLTEVDPATGAKKTLRQLVNNTGQDGVDGIALDPGTGDILIPDSPNGRLLRMSRDGSKLTTIASGFVRPTGVAVEAGGSLVVADEFGNAVYRLSTSGRRTRIASIFQPDDVVVGADGGIYVNSLGGTISRIDPATTNHLTTLTSGLKLPHGLGIDPQGNVVVAEAGRNRLLRIVLR